MFFNETNARLYIQVVPVVVQNKMHLWWIEGKFRRKLFDIISVIFIKWG